MDELYKVPLRERIIGRIMTVYLITVALAVPYFSWDNIQKNGAWGLVIGWNPEKAFIWPYYAWEHYRTPPVLPSQAALQVMKFNLVFDLHRSGNDAGERIDHEVQKIKDVNQFLANCPNLLHEVIEYNHKALDTGLSIDIGILNNIYAELGNKFKTLFLEGLRLTIDGCEKGSLEKFHQSKILIGQWNIWYGEHSKEIGDALKNASR